VQLVGSLWLACLAVVAPSSAGVEWETEAEAALERARLGGRVVFVALGVVGEARSSAHLELYDSRSLRPYLEASVNLPAWSWVLGDEERLPDLGGASPRQHVSNLETITERWLRPNESEVVALPQHLWLSAAGEVLLSCPWEMTELELAWCFDEALRRSQVTERPRLPQGAHPPRRLLLGEVLELEGDDSLGRGLRRDELDSVLERLQRRQLTPADGPDVRRIIFTHEASGAKFLQRQFATWDTVGPPLETILDGTIHLVGLSSTALYLPALEQFAEHRRAELRRQVAVAYEQIGSPLGLSSVKRALRKEKDDGVRAEWVRALGACGRGQKAVARTLVRLAEKDRVAHVRSSAILALGHVLPEPGAEAFLAELAREGAPPARHIALLALALGRARGAEPLCAQLAQDEADEESAEVARVALAVLRGEANTLSLREPIDALVPSPVDRWRIFFWRGGR